MRKIIAVILIALSVNAYAACENARTHIDYQVCAADQYDVAFKKLSKTYNRVLKQVDTERQVYIKQAQNAWWRFKDVECDSPLINYGSVGLGAAAQCKADKAIEREKELRQLYLQ